MRSIRTRSAYCFALAIGILTAQTISLDAQGFGTVRKKKLTLQVRQPALVRLANTSIAFKGSATNPEYAAPLASLKAVLETELIGNEKTLVKKPEAEAEWVLGLQVTGYSAPVSKARSETIVKSQPPANYIRWMSSLNVAYEVLDKSGRVHDADNVTLTYDKEFDATARTAIPGIKRIPVFGGPKQTEVVPQNTEDVKQILIKDIVQQIAQKLGNTTNAVEVQVAAGEDHLNRASEFLDQRLWNRAIEELEKAEALPKPEDESYRQYDLGLGYEAMSYDSKSYNDQRANLFKAQEYYDKAIELNRKEKYFVETVARTKEAIARYRTLDAQEKDDKKKTTQTAVAEPVKATVAPGGPAAAPAPPQTPTVKINDVIELYQAKVDEEQIVETIRNSTVEFSPIDKDTMLAIAKAGLPISLQNELRKKVGASLLNPPKAVVPDAPAPAVKPAAPAGKAPAPGAKPPVTAGKPAPVQ